MVQCVYHFVGLPATVEWKWCTSCTIIFAFLRDLAQNGVPGMPFSLALRIISA